MYVTALVDFHENLKGVDRKRGDMFVVTKSRFEEINAVGMERIGAPIVEASAETTPESRAAGKQTPESRAAKRRRETGR